MSSPLLQDLLDEAINNFFPNISSEYITNPFYDICFNLSLPVHPIREEEETKSDSGNSVPDLIPLYPEQEPQIQQQQNPNPQQITMWSNLVDDYNSQINAYQRNIQSILRITENLLPQINTNRPTPSSIPSTPPPLQNQFVSQIRDWLRNRTGTDYVLEFENITPYLFTTNNILNNNLNLATTQEIQNATDLFVNDSSLNSLEYNTCPISLEEFREGEPLMRIRYCGHIFKAFELQRWFLRNTKCPSCRYDIRSNSNNTNI